MRFQLLSVLALLASASAVEAAPKRSNNVAARAGPAVGRPLQRAHSLPHPRRSRHGKRKTCQVRPPATDKAPASSSPAAEAASSPSASASTDAPSTDAPSTGAPSTDASSSASPDASSSASTDAAASDSESEQPAAVSTANNAGSTVAVNTSVKVKAGGVEKWTGTVAPDQSPIGDAIQTFTTGGGIGTNLIAVSGNIQSGSFQDMTIEGNNPGLKTAYGHLRENSDGSVTFTYVKGQVNDNDSWFWYTTADPGNTGMNLAEARTASFTYTVEFQDGFDWKLGGKLPGWYGGDSADAGKHCTGHEGSASCFSSRLMWRDGGIGEIYNYYWGSEQAYCTDPSTYHIGTADIICNSGSGDSLGRGAFHFEAGKPVTITNTISLNTMNGNTPNADGSQSLIVDGVKVIDAQSLVLRHHDGGRIRGLFFSTFFGGSGDSWACPKEQEVTFSDISVSILANL